MDKMATIVGKEWAEVFRNKLVFFSVAFLPLILLVLPLGMLLIMQNVEGASAGIMDQQTMAFFGDQCVGLSEMDCGTVYMLNLFVLLFMILPVAIPVTIAAYSIVGEKTSRSLEPLLATPITTGELITAKAFAAVVPAIAVTWLAFSIFLLGARWLTSAVVFDLFFGPQWILAIVVVSPLLTLLSVCIAIIISSRVTDPRVAEQLSALVILPLMLLVVGQSVGLILINQQIMLIILAVVLVLDAALLYAAVRLFQRETILTKWK